MIHLSTTGTFSWINETQLIDLLAALEELKSSGVTLVQTNYTDTEPSDWTFPASLFFATTIITTIGKFFYVSYSQSILIMFVT